MLGSCQILGEQLKDVYGPDQTSDVSTRQGQLIHNCCQISELKPSLPQQKSCVNSTIFSRPGAIHVTRQMKVRSPGPAKTV